MDTVGRNKKTIEEYIKNQLQDIVADQISLKEYIDPFTGGKNSKAEKKAALAAACGTNAVGEFFDAS